MIKYIFNAWGGMKNVRLCVFGFISFLILLFSVLPVFAIPCGKVPVYCVVIESYMRYDYSRGKPFVAPEPIGEVQTQYRFGNAAPICKTESFNP